MIIPRGSSDIKSSRLIVSNSLEAKAGFFLETGPAGGGRKTIIEENKVLVRLREDIVSRTYR